MLVRRLLSLGVVRCVLSVLLFVVRRGCVSCVVVCHKLSLVAVV